MSAQGNSARKGRKGRASAAADTSAAAGMSEAEREEFERAEEARRNSGGFMGEGMQQGSAKEFGPSFRKLLSLLAPFKAMIGLAAVLGVFAVLLTVAAPRLLGQATNLLFEGFVSAQLPPGTTKQQVADELRASGQEQFASMVEAMHITPGEGIDFTQLGTVLLWVVVIYLAAELCMWLQGYLMNRAMVEAMRRLRSRVEGKITRLPLSYFDGTRRGELLSRVTNDIDNMTQALQQTLSSAITNLLMVIGVLVMMLSISWQLTLVALIVLPLIGIIMGVLGPRAQKSFTAQWARTGRLNGRVEESFSGHALVRVFGREEQVRRAFAEENEELYRASFRAQFLSGVMMPVMMFIGNLSYVGIAVAGGLLVAGGQLRLGDVQAFIQYSQQFTQPLSQLGGMAPVVQSATASAERVFELLEAEEEAADPPADAAPRPPAEGCGAIEFRDVSFSYSPDRPLIEGLNLKVAPGQTVAIVGPTGAGKTTLVNLLMRFYELDGGAILLDGQDISAMRRHDVRARTGMVLQDPWLFQGTILENIRYGRSLASDEEVLAAARASYVDRFVQTLPDGYDTVLDEDASNVSAGERQLITIARAFVADPQVLILDEATSSVDTRTELLLQRAMAALRQGRTSFVIAHRLSTIRDADVILVMKHGSIVEQGSHEELLAAGGAYARLHAAQFEAAASPEE